MAIVGYPERADDVYNACAVLAEGTVQAVYRKDAPPKQDTTIDAVTFDTSVASFPPLGFEPTLLVARLGAAK